MFVFMYLRKWMFSIKGQSGKNLLNYLLFYIGILLGGWYRGPYIICVVTLHHTVNSLERLQLSTVDK